MPAQAPASYLAQIEAKGDIYTLQLPTPDPWNKSARLQTLATVAGVVWSPPQPLVGVDRPRPVGPATIYLTPYKLGGSELAGGSKEILRLPLLERDGPTDVYVLLGQLLEAGDWVVTVAGRSYSGMETVYTRLDAVNVVTGATRFVTYGNGTGGHYFKYRVEPGRVYWEQRHWGSPNFVLDESAMMDLATGERRTVPPAPGGNSSSY